MTRGARTQLEGLREELAEALRERDELTARVAELERDLAAARLPVDLSLSMGKRPITSLVVERERSLDAMPLERAEIVGRCVVLHLYKGQPGFALDAVKGNWKHWTDERRKLAGRDLLDASLAAATGLPLRILNALEGAGILTVGHLLALGADVQRLEIPSVSYVTLRTVGMVQKDLARRAKGALLPPAPKVPLRRHVPAPAEPRERSYADPGYAFNEPTAADIGEALTPAELAQEFNRRWPVGAAVSYWPALDGSAQPQRTRILKGAFVQAGEAVCFVEGIRGVVSIEQISDPGPDRRAYRQKKNHPLTASGSTR